MERNEKQIKKNKEGIQKNSLAKENLKETGSNPKE